MEEAALPRLVADYGKERQCRGWWIACDLPKCCHSVASRNASTCALSPYPLLTALVSQRGGFDEVILRHIIACEQA